MTPTLADLQTRHPGAKYEPDPNCPRCVGKGEWWISKAQYGPFAKERMRPCACIYFPHEHVSLIHECIQAIGKDEK